MTPVTTEREKAVQTCHDVIESFIDSIIERAEEPLLRDGVEDHELLRAAFIARGALSRLAEAARRPVPDFRCAECGKDALDQYMLRDEVWLSIMPDKRGHLHLACCEKRLGRALSVEDLKDVPMNAAIRHFAARKG